MIKIGETIILTNGESPYDGTITVNAINRADNIISIEKNPETDHDVIKIIKIRDRKKFEELNSMFAFYLEGNVGG